MITTDGRYLCIGGIDVKSLVERYGTPLYVYDEDTMLKRLDEISSNVNGLVYRIYYSMKANSNPSIIKIFYERGLGIGTVSPGEIFIALSSGVDPVDIIFSGNNLSNEDIRYAIDFGVNIDVDSHSSLRKLCRIGFKGEIGIRVNPLFGYGQHRFLVTSGYGAKFGIPINEVYEAVKIAESYKIRIKRLHIHLGSGILSVEPYLKALEVLARIASNIESVEELNIGGGYAVPYRDKDRRFPWQKFRLKLKSKIDELRINHYKILVEPGRYLVAESGVLLTRITDIRRVDRERYIVGTDTGINHIIRPALYNAYHKIVVANRVDEKPSIVADVVGNLCESSDVIGSNRMLPRVSEGDILAVMNTGAYCYSMASNYNSRLLPAEILVRKSGKVIIIRKRQSFRQLIENTEVVR